MVEVLGVVGLALLVLLVWAMQFRPFWALVFTLGAIAATMACLACLVRFEILGAMGFLVLGFLLAVVAGTIAEGRRSRPSQLQLLLEGF